jgi:FHS family L-fucose permease-like MFS transporter
MAIVGGAVVPVLQGGVSDALGSLQMSFVVSAVCFLGILWYFRSNLRHHVADDVPEPALQAPGAGGAAT